MLTGKISFTSNVVAEPCKSIFGFRISPDTPYMRPSTDKPPQLDLIFSLDSSNEALIVSPMS